MVTILHNTVYNLLRLSPNSLRKLLYLIPIKYRLGGKDFSETLSFLKTSDKWDNEKILKYQKKELKRLLEHTVKHVPFYSDMSLMSEDPFKNLEEFPIIDKEIIKENVDLFKADNIKKKDTYHVTTSGTTGEPLSFYLDKHVYGKEWAFVINSWQRVGLTPGDKIISFRGVEFKNASKNIFWQENPIYNMLEFSPFHMNDENLPLYIEKIKKYKPKFIHGYPSAISILADYVNKNVDDFPSIKAILAISENVYPNEREFIQRTFNSRLFSFYGMSEKVIMAAECEFDISYHSYPEYGITEFIDSKENAVQKGERGELVGTSFLNYCMPFIRYRTGDNAVYGENKCKCGRNHQILEDLIGRGASDIVIGKRGTKIPFNALYIAIHSDVLSKILKFQFHQKKLGQLLVRIVPKIGFTDKDKTNFHESLSNKVGNELEIEIKIVDDIKLTDRGKSKLLIQESSV